MGKWDGMGSGRTVSSLPRVGTGSSSRTITMLQLVIIVGHKKD